MILDTLENSARYESLNSRFAKALAYLRTVDGTQPLGRFDLDGDHCFALVQTYETKLMEKAKFEAHRKYIDVQYIVSGIEKMGYAPIDHLQVVTPYDETKDAEMLKGTGDFLTAQPGMFLVFFPHDAHMPGLAADQPMKVKKVVVKIAV